MTHPPSSSSPGSPSPRSAPSTGTSTACRLLPPLYFLHVWWARRPLITSRAAILAGVLPAWSADWPTALRDRFPDEETSTAGSCNSTAFRVIPPRHANSWTGPNCKSGRSQTPMPAPALSPLTLPPKTCSDGRLAGIDLGNARPERARPVCGRRLDPV